MHSRKYRDQYLAYLNEWDDTGSPSGEENVINTLTKLVPQLSREAITAKLAVKLERTDSIYIPGPPLLIDNTCHVFVVRAWDGRLMVTLGGVVDLSQSAVPQYAYMRQLIDAKEARAAVDWANAAYGLIPRPEWAARHVIVTPNSGWLPIVVGYSSQYLNEERPLSVRWSAAGHIWTGDPFESSELLVVHDKREAICYCGSCSMAIPPGLVCPICRIVYATSTTLDTPASAPCEVVAIAQQYGHVFDVDPVQARVREYSEWVNGMTQQLRQAAPVTEYNKLQRSVDIGTN